MGTDAARMSARSPFIGAMIPISPHRPCNTSANCVVDQRPQFVLGNLFERFLALVELFLAPANLFLAAVEVAHVHVLPGVAHLVQAVLFMIELPLLLRDYLLLRTERDLVGEECRGALEIIGIFDQKRAVGGADPE